jgi:hypothetical protein
MPDRNDPPHKDDPPNNVIPFPNNIPHAVAQGLRDYYASLLSEPMPDKIAALSRAFEELSNEAEEQPNDAPKTEPKLGKGGQP